MSKLKEFILRELVSNKKIKERFEVVVKKRFGTMARFFYEQAKKNDNNPVILAMIPQDKRKIEGDETLLYAYEGFMKYDILTRGRKELPDKFSDDEFEITYLEAKEDCITGMEKKIEQKKEIIRPPKPEEKDEEDRKTERQRYLVFIPNANDIGTNTIEASEAAIKSFLNKREKFDILVYGRSVYVKKSDDKAGKSKPVFMNLEERLYKLLVMLLRYKDMSLNVKSLFRKAWADVNRDRDGIPEQDKIIVRDYLKTPMSQIRAFVPTKDLLDIVKPRNSPFYICNGTLSYCVIIDKKDRNKFELSDAEEI